MSTPINPKRLKFWIAAALDAARRKQEVYEHVCTALLPWDGKVINKRLWEAIYADPWYKAHGYSAHHLAYTYADYLEVRTGYALSDDQRQQLKRMPDYSYRDEAHYDELQKFTLTIRNKNDEGNRFSLAAFQEHNAPHLNSTARLEELLSCSEEHAQQWSYHIKRLETMHEAYSTAFYLLGTLLDISVSRDW